MTTKLVMFTYSIYWRARLRGEGPLGPQGDNGDKERKGDEGEEGRAGPPGQPMNPQALAIQMGAVPSPPNQQPPRAMGGMGGGAGEVTFGYSGNIPESSYYLLLGA